MPQIHRSGYGNRLLKIDTLAQIARNLPSDLGIEILSHFFSSLRFSQFLSFKFRFSGFRVLLHKFSTHLKIVSITVSLSHTVVWKLKGNLYTAFLLYSEWKKNDNRNCPRVCIGYGPTDRPLSGTGWSSQTWLRISPAWLPGTHLDIHRQLPLHSAMGPGQACFPSSPDDF